MPTTNIVRTEFAAAVSQITNDRNISTQAVIDSIKQALISAYRKNNEDQLDEAYYHFAQVDENTGESKIFRSPVLSRDEETGEIKDWDEQKIEDVTPAGFGRIAAQTAKQVILQKIREAEQDQILSDFSQRMGEVMTAQVLRMDGRTVVVDLGGRGQGFMPPEEQMRGEFYRMNGRIQVLIKDIRETYRGRRVVVSRSDHQLVSGLFAKEVPEVAAGAVEIVSIAREAGVRTKLAVRSTQEGVDPVGSCVGQRGVRVQQIITELNNEKIDIIPFSENEDTYLQSALSPAEGLKIEFDKDKHTAVVTVPAEQLSLAIGRGGQNVRLAAKLTGWRITIVSDGKVESEVTGEEEYEIDSLEGLSPESREYLIHHKLTTTADVVRFQDKWQAETELADDQKAILQGMVDVFEEEERKKEAAARAFIEGGTSSDEPTESTEEAGNIN